MKQRHLIKFISVLLTLVLFTLAVPFAANAAEAADVMDEGAKTFRIATAEGLKRLSSECSAKGNWKGWTITLEADIVLNTGDKADWETTAPANVWTPIPYFSGTLDGQGHSISGVYIMGNSRVGLIAVADGAVIKNFKMLNSYIGANSNNWAVMTGAIVGDTFNNGVVYENLTVDAIVKGMLAEGNTYPHGAVGGITGFVRDLIGETVFRNCVMLGRVESNGVCVGGLMGYAVNNNQPLTLEGCVNAATVRSPKAWVGGLIGTGADPAKKAGTINLTNCVSLGVVLDAEGPSSFVGQSVNTTLNVSGCWYDSKVADYPCNFVALDTGARTIVNGVTTGGRDATRDEMYKVCHAIDLFTETGASLRATVGSTGLRWESKIEKKAYDALSALPCVESVALGTLITPTQFAAKAGGMTREKLETLNKAVKYLDVPMTAGAWFRSSDTHYGFAGSVGEISDPSHFNLKYSGIGYLTLRFAGGLSVTLTADYHAENHSRTVASVARAALADADNGLTAEQIAAITPYAEAYDSSKEY